MYFYKAFGLRILSEIAVPQFLPASVGPVDIVIKFGRVRPLLTEETLAEHVTQTDSGEVCFLWDQIGRFCVRSGSEIMIEPISGVDSSLLSLPLTGTVLATLLHTREMLVLHASAVSLDRRGVVFVGWKGAGKSTTSALLYNRGHKMISDDIVALKGIEIDSPNIVPGYPNFKLMPETAVSVMGDDPEALLPIYEGAEKRFRPATDNFSDADIPLESIYALEDGPDLEVQLMSPQEAMSTLIANTFVARYGRQLLQKEDAVTNFHQCSKIVNSVPVYRLRRPKSFSSSDRLVELLENHGIESFRAYA